MDKFNPGDRVIVVAYEPIAAGYIVNDIVGVRGKVDKTEVGFVHVIPDVMVDGLDELLMYEWELELDNS